jgi:hypothetical protein
MSVTQQQANYALDRIDQATLTPEGWRREVLTLRAFIESRPDQHPTLDMAEALYQAIRGTGYVTRSQADDIVDLIEPLIAAYVQRPTTPEGTK